MCMKITDALAADHQTYCEMFGFMEEVLPSLNTLIEVKMLGGLVERLLTGHAKIEEESVLVALDHALMEKGQHDQFHQEHQELDERLTKLRDLSDFVEARQVLHEVISASRAHFAYEEQIVFPKLEKALSRETLEKLGEAFLNRGKQKF